jgi:hypothetical protein
MFQEWTLIRLPQKILQYHPKGKIRIGRPLKHLMGDIQLKAETDHMVQNL